MLTPEQLDACIQSLCAPNVLTFGGETGVVYRYSRWHLITVRKHNGRPTIHSVHFMNEEAVRHMFRFYTRPPQVLTYADMGSHFAQEIDRAILPTAQEYAERYAAGEIQFSVGNTSDTTEVLGSSVSVEQCASAVQKAMDTEIKGFALVFVHTV